MNEVTSSDEVTISPINLEDIQKIGKETIENIISGNNYLHNKVNQWTNTIVEQVLGQLTKLNKSYKFVVTCVIVQKNGAGLHTSTSCFWDNSTDTNCLVRWENKSMHCILQVFALSI